MGRPKIREIYIRTQFNLIIAQCASAKKEARVLFSSLIRIYLFYSRSHAPSATLNEELFSRIATSVVNVVHQNKAVLIQNLLKLCRRQEHFAVMAHTDILFQYVQSPEANVI